ncbi:kinase-like domain-containing protein [Coprinopsis sp. MPI-PUGE-AT-0042]|nr:kinase-like domain-containing protein [Coprinopsis sp. MPI-PUGE-AT-0042]
MRINPYIQEAGIENYTEYRPGGYHPVHLGDTFQDGRYTVVNKLGYGTYSTVWLVRDESQGSFASLKILSAHASERSSGTELDVFRRSAAGSGMGKRFVLQFLDSFVHQGPNGDHLCVVTEVSGPNLATYLGGIGPCDELTPEIARSFVLQSAQGVEYLHSCGIVHGDLHLGNLLYHLPYFGAPETLAIRVVKDASPLYDVPHIPRYVVYSPDSSLFLEPLFENPSLAELKICDFSESSLHDPATSPSGIKRKLNCPNVHAAPEVIFDDLASPASDIWALGNTIHQIMTGGGTESLTAIPGSPGCSRDEVLCHMVRIFGKLPERWWSRWEKRSEYFDDEGRWVAGKETPSPEGALCSGIPAVYLSESEKEAFRKVLSGIFVYEPEDRLTARGLVEELARMRLAPTRPVLASG